MYILCLAYNFYYYCFIIILGLLTRAVELRQWVEPFYLTCGDVVNGDNIDLGLAYSWRNAIIDKNSIHTECFEQFELYSSFLSNIIILYYYTNVN